MVFYWKEFWFPIFWITYFFFFSESWFFTMKNYTFWWKHYFPLLAFEFFRFVLSVSFLHFKPYNNTVLCIYTWEGNLSAFSIYTFVILLTSLSQVLINILLGLCSSSSLYSTSSLVHLLILFVNLLHFVHFLLHFVHLLLNFVLLHFVHLLHKKALYIVL